MTADICDIFDQLRADIAQAQRKHDRPALEELQREFALLELMLEGWRPDDDEPRHESA